jgi:molecular chaperone GrpE (heat shock protein)
LSPEEASQRAAKAQQLLNDEMLKESFDNAEKALNQAVRSAKTPEEAFKAVIACQVFELIRNQISSHIETAKVIEFNFKNKSFIDRVVGR